MTHREFLGEIPEKSEGQRQAEIIWLLYANRTETFDRVLPGHWIRPDNWMPRPDCMRASREHARLECEHAEKECTLANITDVDNKSAREWVKTLSHTQVEMNLRGRGLLR